MNKYQTNTTAKTSTLPVSLQQAKDQLRVVNEGLDEQIELALAGAVEFCENQIGRSLRVSHTVMQSYPSWPCNPVRFDRQPAYSIVSIVYFDADDAELAVSASDYRLLPSSGGASVLCFDSSFTKPAIYDRPDAVQITYLAGYADIADVPKAAVNAILFQLENAWGEVDKLRYDANERARNVYLSSIDPGLYR